MKPTNFCTLTLIFVQLTQYFSIYFTFPKAIFEAFQSFFILLNKEKQYQITINMLALCFKIFLTHAIHKL